MHKEHNLK